MGSVALSSNTQLPRLQHPFGALSCWPWRTLSALECHTASGSPDSPWSWTCRAVSRDRAPSGRRKASQEGGAGAPNDSSKLCSSASSPRRPSEEGRGPCGSLRLSWVRSVKRCSPSSTSGLSIRVHWSPPQPRVRHCRRVVREAAAARAGMARASLESDPVTAKLCSPRGRQPASSESAPASRTRRRCRAVKLEKARVSVRELAAPPPAGKPSSRLLTEGRRSAQSPMCAGAASCHANDCRQPPAREPSSTSVRISPRSRRRGIHCSPYT